MLQFWEYIHMSQLLLSLFLGEYFMYLGVYECFMCMFAYT